MKNTKREETAAEVAAVVENPKAAETARETETGDVKPASFAEMVDEASARANLSVKDAMRIRQLLEPVSKGEVDEQLVTMLAQALSRDEDLKNADAAGYVRGKNEKIEIVNRFDSGQVETRPVNFPRYDKRGFWDDVK